MPTLLHRLEGEGRLAVVSIGTRALSDIGEKLSDREAGADRAAPDAVGSAVKASLHELWGCGIRKDDLVASDLPGGDNYYIFLSRAREKWQAEIGDLENVALRVQEFVYNRLFDVYYGAFGRGPRVLSGYGVTYPSAAEESANLIRNLIGEAESIAPFLVHKIGLMRRMALHDVILNRKVFVRFRPVVLLETNHVLGYEAETGGPEETFLGAARNLTNFAREAGFAGELGDVCRTEVLAKARGIDRESLLFLEVDLETSFGNDAVTAEFGRLLEQNGIDEGRLVFQVKSRPLGGGAAALDRLEAAFCRAQISVEIDETWTENDVGLLDGHRLKFLKAGRRILAGALEEGGALPLVRALVGAADRLGLSLIAGGVMSGEEAAAAASLGAVAGQGPYFNRAETPGGGLAYSNEDLKDRYLQKKMLLSIYLKRGRDYFHRDEYDKAILEFSKVLEIDPLNVESYYYRGHSFCADGVLGMAVKDYLKLKELDPEFPSVRLLEGLIAEKKGDEGRALQAYREYLEYAAKSFDTEIAFAQSRIDRLRAEK
ncbi:MAG: EAL domain-containing protein [Spirochaetales bacterium]|nr:EAL domain-containing protein [Spirochaetales bacterium]